MGFTAVFDYRAGELDWIAFGLPTEGKKANVLRVHDVMRRDVPVCPIEGRLGDARAIAGNAWNICVVTNQDRIVLGLLYGDAWNHPDDTPVELAMSNGPPTTRPDTFIDDMVERLRRRATPGIIISNPIGELMGYLWTSDAERALATGNCTHTWAKHDYCPSES